MFPIKCKLIAACTIYCHSSIFSCKNAHKQCEIQWQNSNSGLTNSHLVAVHLFIRSYPLNVNDFWPKSLHLLLEGIYSNRQPKAQRVIAWHFIAWGEKLSFQNHLFRVEKMEQNSSFYSEHLSLAVFALAQHKAVVLIFLLPGPPTSFFLQLSGLQDGLDYTCWDAYFFLCWNRCKLNIHLGINVIVVVWIKGFNLEFMLTDQFHQILGH